MDLDDKTIASLQPNVFPGRYNLSYKQTRLTFNSSMSKTHIAVRFNLLHFWPSVPPFVFAELLKCSFTVLNSYFYISSNFTAISHA